MLLFLFVKEPRWSVSLRHTENLSHTALIQKQKDINCVYCFFISTLLLLYKGSMKIKHYMLLLFAYNHQSVCDDCFKPCATTNVESCQNAFVLLFGEPIITRTVLCENCLTPQAERNNKWKLMKNTGSCGSTPNCKGRDHCSTVS